VNNELERIWEDAMYHLGICLEGLKRTTKHLRIATVLVEIRNEHFPNTIVGRYRDTVLLGKWQF
jgi:hypothetical protein